MRPRYVLYMICISLSPPYGTLIALGLKRLETRSWSTSHRGLLAIHQTAAPGPRGTTEAALWDRCLSDEIGKALLNAGLGNPARLPRGKIVAVVDLVDCQMIGVLPDGTPAYMAYDEFPPVLQAVQEPERSFGLYEAGRYAWLLANVRALPEPVSARGMPGLWTLPDYIEKEVLHALR